MDAKLTLINQITELSKALQILINFGCDSNAAEVFKCKDKAVKILREQYGAFSLYFEEIKHTIDIEILFAEINKYVQVTQDSDEEFDGDIVLLCVPWLNVYGHSGYVPPVYTEIEQPQQDAAVPEPQQKDLHYYCQKAIEKGYLVKVTDGYRKTREWTKAQLAYFLKHFPNTDKTFPDKKYCVMFGESRLSKAADQLSINKNDGGKPRGYEMVDELLQE